MVMYQRPKKQTVFTGTFFNFLLGFIAILSLSLGIIFVTGSVGKVMANVHDAATAILSL